MVPRFRALGFEFTVVCTEPGLAKHVARLLAPLARAGDEPANGYTIESSGSSYTVRFNGEQLCEDASGDVAVAYLTWHVNQQAVAASSHWLLLHAAGAACDGRAVVFPAKSGSGKTTLVAGLVGCGFSYVTDDVVAIDMTTGEIEPYWKPLSVKQGSWSALADLGVKAGAAGRSTSAPEWSVSPADLGDGRLASPCAVGYVVFPRYERGAVTELTPTSPAQALLSLSECSFNFPQHGVSAFDCASRLVERAECFDLHIGDLGAACQLVSDLVHRT